MDSLHFQAIEHWLRAGAGSTGLREEVGFHHWRTDLGWACRLCMQLWGAAVRSCLELVEACPSWALWPGVPREV